MHATRNVGYASPRGLLRRRDSTDSTGNGVSARPKSSSSPEAKRPRHSRANSTVSLSSAAQTRGSESNLRWKRKKQQRGQNFRRCITAVINKIVSLVKKEPSCRVRFWVEPPSDALFPKSNTRWLYHEGGDREVCVQEATRSEAVDPLNPLDMSMDAAFVDAMDFAE